MINGAHWLLYSKDAAADRAFLRDTLGLQFVDVGQGWLIFKAPPSELAMHPVEGEPFVQKHAEHELIGAILYLMCDDIDATLKMLKAKTARVRHPSQRRGDGFDYRLTKRRKDRAVSAGS